MHDFDGNEEKYYGREGKLGDLEWTAFPADCEHEIETVPRGVGCGVQLFGSPCPQLASMGSNSPRVRTVCVAFEKRKRAGGPLGAMRASGRCGQTGRGVHA